MPKAPASHKPAPRKVTDAAKALAKTGRGEAATSLSLLGMVEFPFPCPGCAGRLWGLARWRFRNDLAWVAAMRALGFDARMPLDLPQRLFCSVCAGGGKHYCLFCHTQRDPHSACPACRWDPWADYDAKVKACQPLTVVAKLYDPSDDARKGETVAHDTNDPENVFARLA